MRKLTQFEIMEINARGISVEQFLLERRADKADKILHAAEE